MIELEIQTLSERREGLLMEVGRSVTASGFVLQRQRLSQDANGVLMTLIVRGPPRKRRALEAVLQTHERLISVQVFLFDEGDSKPHFAAARTLPRPPVTAAAVPAPAAKAAPVAPTPLDPPKPSAPILPTPSAPIVVEALLDTADADEPDEPDLEFILPTPRAAPALAAAVVVPFVDVVPLEADEPAVDKALQELERTYPQFMASLLTLGNAVAAGARESSLLLAGQRMGTWVFQSEQAPATEMDLSRAIQTIALPALQALLAIEQDGDQLHIFDSPLCHEDGHSGCAFFNGFAQGILGPAMGSQVLTIFPVCCRSYGADACVLALSV